MLHFNFDAAGLSRAVYDYWTYMYLNGKYYKRADLFRLASTQHCLFERHVNVLRFLQPERQWDGWAAKDVRYLSAEFQMGLYNYLRGVSMEVIGAVLQEEMDAFARDAQAVCRYHGVPYTSELEEAVRSHLHKILESP